MPTRFWRMLNVEKNESGRVRLLLIMSFLMGLFIATVGVASQSLLLGLSDFSEKDDLPYVLLYSGVFSVGATFVYNFLHKRVSFRTLAIFHLMLLVGLTAVMEFGASFFGNARTFYSLAFSLVLPFTFIIHLVFWDSFGRMFNTRDANRLIGSMDVGTDIASVIAFFAIPVLLVLDVEVAHLYVAGLISIIGYLFFFIISNRYLDEEKIAEQESSIKKLGVGQLLNNRYILLIVSLIIISLTVLRFVDYSFFNVPMTQFYGNTNGLAIFLSPFETIIMIFSFIFTTFMANRIAQYYGLRAGINARVIHGVNRLAITMLLIAIIYFVIKRFL